MLTFIIALLLLGLALFGILLRKTYNYMPRRELKRQAQQGDQVAKVLYKAVAYGASLRLLLWIIIGLAVAGGFVLFVRIAPPLLAFFAVAGLLWYGFVWMPAAPISGVGAKFVIWTTPFIAWVLNYLHPLFSRLSSAAETRRTDMYHTGLYERGDLVEFLELQRSMADSRISGAEIDMAIHALTFGDRTVSEIMIPKRVIKMVHADEVVGPILINELHQSGFSRFPVFEGNGESIIGTLYLRDLLQSRQGGRVHSVMRGEVHYVHEDQDLYRVLDAFIKTKHHMFVVVNSFEEFVGLVTIEDVIEQVIGHKIQDEFDKYDDMRAVAASQAQAAYKKRVEVSDSVTETD